MKETKETIVYECGFCGKLYRNKEQADLCHQDRTCSECGTTIGKLDYYSTCGLCRSKKKREKDLEIFEKATKLTYDEYMDLYPDYPVIYNDVFYFDDLDCLLDTLEENQDEIAWVWGASKKIEKLDAHSIIERFEENTELEDYEMDEPAVESIVKFCDEWNEKYGQPVYYESAKIAVKIR